MIAFTAPLWLWTGEGGSWHFVTVPAEQSAEIRLEAAAAGPRRGFGSVRVEARIDDPSTGSGQAVTWRTSVFPQKSGTYLLPVKADVRRRAGISAGDEVTVMVELV